MEDGVTGLLHFHMVLELAKYSKHITNISLPWYIIVPPHGIYIKVNIKPTKGDLPIVETNKYLIFLQLIP